jgi:hypothetical protein
MKEFVTKALEDFLKASEKNCDKNYNGVLLKEPVYIHRRTRHKIVRVYFSEEENTIISVTNKEFYIKWEYLTEHTKEKIIKQLGLNKDYKPDVDYLIRVFICDQENVRSKTGFLGRYPRLYEIVHSIEHAAVFFKKEEAIQYIEKIINEKPSMLNGELRAPEMISKIGFGYLGKDYTRLDFRLSVVSIDADKLEIKEHEYYCGTISSKDFEIVLTAKGNKN